MYIRCLLFFIAFVACNASKARFDGKILVSVIPTEEKQFQYLSSLEDNNLISIWNELARNRSVHVMIDRLNQSVFMPIFEALNLKPKVLIDNVQKLIDVEEQQAQVQSRMGVARTVQNTFLKFEEITAWLQQMATTYSTLATLESIGKTYGNRDIWLMKLTSKNGAQKKKVFMDFGIHAREWISPATGLYMINEFLTTYAAGGDAARMLDTWELHIVPVLNPDGYAYTHSNDRMWRKNRKPVSGGCIGVDLNRNFGHKWNTGGSSPQACSDTFHGGSPMSENEAKALQNYMRGKPWDTYLTFHSYGQWWFTNWGYNSTLPANYPALEAKAIVGANAIRGVNGRQYTIGSSSRLLYVASGGSEDWTAGDLGITFSYCLELPPTGSPGFIVSTAEIPKTGRETYVGVVAYLKTF